MANCVLMGRGARLVARGWSAMTPGTELVLGTGTDALQPCRNSNTQDNNRVRHSTANGIASYKTVQRIYNGEKRDGRSERHTGGEAKAGAYMLNCAVHVQKDSHERNQVAILDSEWRPQYAIGTRDWCTR